MDAAHTEHTKETYVHIVCTSQENVTEQFLFPCGPVYVSRLYVLYICFHYNSN